MAWKHVASFRLVPPPSITTALGAAAATARSSGSAAAASPIQFHIVQGSVIDFCPTDNNASLSSTLQQQQPRLHRRAAIVNAANEECLGGGGVDGAITKAGGPNLARDRKALPHVPLKKRIRCPTGQARMTGPGDYGSLHVPYVIHAVGPNYWRYDESNNMESRYDDNNQDGDEQNNIVNVDLLSAKYQKGHALLRSAYFSSLECARHHQLQQIAFPLLSAGVYRGRVPLSFVLRVGVEAIQDWVLEQQQHSHQQQQQHHHQALSLQRIYICGFTDVEAQTLIEVCEELQLHRDYDDVAGTNNIS